MLSLAAGLRETVPEDDVKPQRGTAGGATRPSPSPLRSGPGGRKSAFGVELAQMTADHDEMRGRYEELLRDNEKLKADSRRRVEGSLRREQRYENELLLMRTELSAHQHKSGGGTPMATLRDTHRAVLDGVASLKQRTASVLAEQERDLLRAFRARLYDVQIELERERSKKDDGALEWIEKSRSLGKELDWSREEALRLDRSNQHLQKESSRLKAQLKSFEDDREMLVRQTLALKKENAKLKRHVEENEASSASAASDAAEALSRSQGGPVEAPSPNRQARPGFSRPTSAAGGGAEDDDSAAARQRLKELMARQAEAEARSREMMGKLKRLLEVERRNLRAVRMAHAKDLQSRTELEGLLRACADDVRREVNIHRSGAKGGAGGWSAGREVAVASLSPAERERVLELLLSQERVVALLYDKTFATPPHGAEPVATHPELITEPTADELGLTSDGDQLPLSP